MLRRDRWVVVAALAMVITAAWIWIVFGAGTGTTAVAMTQYREWSSIPVTIFTSAPLATNALAVTSSCHNSIGLPRSQRR